MRAIPLELPPSAVRPGSGYPNGRGARTASRVLAFSLLAALLLAGITSATATQLSTAPASTPIEPSPSELSELVFRIAGQNDPQARMDAATLILQSGSTEGTKSLLHILETKNNEAAKLAICQAITQLQVDEPAFIPPLLLLLDYKEPALREAAAAALGVFHDPQVTARLKELEHQLLEKRFMAQSKQLYALLPMDTDRVAQLQRWLKSGLALERVTALEIIHDNMSLGTRPSPDVLEQIRQMLGDKDERVRSRLIVVLRDIRQPEDAPSVRAMLQKETSPTVREEIYKALAYLGDPASLPACIAGLAEPADTVAAQAAAALGRLAAKGQTIPPANIDMAVTALLDRAGQPMDHPLLREQIIEAMAQIADPRFLPVLYEHVGSNERLPAVRQAALVGIGQIGDDTKVDRVVDRLVSDPDPGVREAAADALGKIGNKVEHLEILRGRMDPKLEASPTVQNRAWEAYKLLFGKILAPGDLEAALKTWENPDPVTVGRRIELLAALDKQMSKSQADPQRVAWVREQLGDAYVSGGRLADAASAFAGALDVLAPTEIEAIKRVEAKLVDAHLRTPAPEKAISAIRDLKYPAIRDVLLGHLLEYTQQTAITNPATVATLLDKMSELVPNRFGSKWSAQFDGVRKSLPAATQPVTTRPEGRRT